jgi:DNA-binding YbaB/EbfC family protein
MNLFSINTNLSKILLDKFFIFAFSNYLNEFYKNILESIMSFNIQEMLEKAKNVQSEMERIKNQASSIVVNGEAGGGMVNIKMNAINQVLEVKISPELIETKDVEMLQDLMVAAINNAVKAAQDEMKKEMATISGMLPNIPGMNLGF